MLQAAEERGGASKAIRGNIQGVGGCSEGTPKPSEIVKRCKFNSRLRQSGESILTFVSQLHSLHGRTLQLRYITSGHAQGPVGVWNQQPTHAAAATGKLKFDSAFSLTLSLEAAAKNVRALQGAVAAVTETQTTESTVRKVDTRAKQSQRSSRGAPR